MSIYTFTCETQEHTFYQQCQKIEQRNKPKFCHRSRQQRISHFNLNARLNPSLVNSPLAYMISFQT